MKNKKATFGMLVKMCEKIGWDKGIESLEKQTLKLEWLQADLYGGTSSQIRQAKKLSKTIIKQNITIGKLKQYKRKNVDGKENDG